MSKTAIVYWSGTGNTEALANKIYESAKSLGKDLPCSALTAGAAVNGCANGKMIAEI